MATPGRSALSNFEKAKRGAARKYRKLLEIKKLTEEEILGSRKGLKHMGRPAVSKEERIRRAKADFIAELDNYRRCAAQESILLRNVRQQLRELRTYRSEENIGRKKADRVIELKEYIRREHIRLAQAQHEPCPLERFSGRGRKPMSKEEKIAHHQARIAETQAEVDVLIAAAPFHQQLYYELHDARLEVSRIKAAIDDIDREIVPKSLVAALADAEIQRDNIERKFNAALQAAGLEKVKDIEVLKPLTTSETLSNAVNAVLNLHKKSEERKIAKLKEKIQGNQDTLSNLTTQMPNLPTALSNLTEKFREKGLSESDLDELLSIRGDKTLLRAIRSVEQLPRTAENMRMIKSAESVKLMLASGDRIQLENPYLLTQFLRLKLLANEMQQGELEELARIIIKRSELRLEHKKLADLLGLLNEE